MNIIIKYIITILLFIHIKIIYNFLKYLNLIYQKQKDIEFAN